MNTLYLIPNELDSLVPGQFHCFLALGWLKPALDWCILSITPLDKMLILYYISRWFDIVESKMALDTVITSPHRRSQAQNNAFASPSFTRQSSRANELGNFKTMVQRHRFLLTALALLVLLCTIYLYFAVTLGSRISSSSDSCSGLTGAEKASCHLQLAKDAMAMGKLKHFF